MEWLEVGGTGSLFSRFLWITRSLWRKREKLHKSHPSCLPILYVSTNFNYDRTNDKKNKLTCTMSAQKTTLLECISLTTSKETSAHSFLSYMANRNEVHFRCMERFFIFFLFKKNAAFPSRKFLWNKLTVKTRNNSNKKNKHEKIFNTFVEQANPVRFI